MSLPAYREHAITKFQNELGGSSEALATEVEAALFARCGQGDAYSRKLRSLLFNMGRNNMLVQHIRNGKLSADELLRMSPDEMLPREEEEHQKELEEKAFNLQRLDHVAPQVADMEDKAGVVCPACGSKRVGTIRRNAISDAEEAMVESSCQSCGKMWVREEQAVGEGW